MNGKRIHNRRKELKLSGNDLAHALNTTRTTIYRWEAGQSEPNDQKKIELAKILKTSVAYLMGETDDKGVEESFAYWGEVLDKAQGVINRGNMKEISLIGNILKTAYELFTPEYELNNSNININAKNNFGTHQVVVAAQ